MEGGPVAVALKKFLCAVLALAFVFAAAFGGGNAYAAEDGPFVEKSSVDLKDAFVNGDWSEGYGVLSIARRRSEKGTALFVSATQEEKTYMNLSVYSEDGIDVSGYTELCLEVALSGNNECTLTIDVSTEAGAFSSECRIKPGSQQKAYFPLAGDICMYPVNSIDLTVYCSDGAPTSFTLFGASADKGYVYSYMTLFSATDVYCNSGDLELFQDSILVTPVSGKAELGFYGKIASSDENKDSLVWIQLEGASSGNVSANVSYNGTQQRTVGAQSLYRGRRTYAFVISGKYDALSFVFDGVKSGSDGAVTVTGAGKRSAWERRSDDYKGSITSCKFDSATGNVTVSGAVARDAAVEYINGTLELYAIPLWESGGNAVDVREPIAAMGVSTRFELSASPSEPYSLCKYVVILRRDERTAFVAAPVMADSGSASALNVSSSATPLTVSGLYGTGSAEIFESNVSSTVIDVCAGKLFETEDIYAAQLYALGSSYFYFDTGYLSEITSQVRFCSSAGAKVYLRLMSGSSGKTFEFSAVSKDSLLKLYAVASFLSETCPEINGIIPGGPVDFSENGEGAQKYAVLCAVINESLKSKAAANSQNRCVVIPVAQSSSDIAPEQSAALTSALVSRSLSELTSSSYMLMYHVNGTDGVGSDGSAALEAAHTSGVFTSAGSSIAGTGVMWEPGDEDPEWVINTFSSLCAKAAETGLSCSVLSAANLNVNGDFYDRLKRALSSDDHTLLKGEAVENDSENHTGRYSLWDFTDSYDTAGWVSGGSFTGAYSAAGFSGGRALQATISQGSKEAGILVCWLKNSLDLTSVFEAEVAFCLADSGSGFAVKQSQNMRKAEISVIFGSGEERAEYFATVDVGRNYTLSCDLSKFNHSFAVDYVAILVRGADGVDAQLYKMSACSDTYTDEELAEKLSPTAAKITVPPAAAIASVIMAAATVAIFAALVRRKRT